ncbi:hypothetical protein INR75_04440 [Zunongwangia sp. SCSIO 43204]|uniref:hypothetical protein n=1 Tax=Zunongwangia sp. SCSIO 43204 TaxID=2779359 RepID=UPI001CA96012|nr:hypothetical protein [Zunongwangia sp. SCSIO 43204]UAB85276.1 hypothetical protein INR75_04440 [Zunongwangia sp. SCSIO 43204]
MERYWIFLGLIFCLSGCRITTHSVPNIEGSRIVQTENGQNYYLFQTKLQRPIAKSWFKNYLDLNREDDLVRSEIILFPELDKEFLVTIRIKDDREVYTDIPVAEKILDSLLGNDDDENTYEESEFNKKDRDDNTGPIKFFVNISISDNEGIDHISTSSLYSSRVRDFLQQLENDFFEYQKNYKALP